MPVSILAIAHLLIPFGVIINHDLENYGFTRRPWPAWRTMDKRGSGWSLPGLSGGGAGAPRRARERLFFAGVTG
jgi:hypothetical protein